LEPFICMYHACINEWRKKIFLYYFMTLSLIIEWHTHMLMYNACSGIYLFFGHIAHRDESLIAWFFECVCVCVVMIYLAFLLYTYIIVSSQLQKVYPVLLFFFQITNLHMKWINGRIAILCIITSILWPWGFPWKILICVTISLLPLRWNCRI
jgi:hypothetical protein